MTTKHHNLRVIRGSKYERQNKDSYNWWMRLFKKMEEEYKIPIHLRKDIATKIFPEKLFEKIAAAVPLIDPKECVGVTSTSTSASFDSSGNRSEKTITSKTEISAGEHEARKDSESQYIVLSNPYLNFIKCPQERAAIWKTLPPISFETMDLNQRSEAITEAIAIDFVAWLLNLGGETKSTLDVAQVMKMFEVGFNTHAATSLMVRVKEMPSVPKYVADIRKQPHKAPREKLKAYIQQDLNASHKKAKSRAFYTTLPKSLRYVPPKAGVVDKWLTRQAPENIASMAMVWEGITDLRSTRSYCKWLIGRPDIPRPKYLESQGMLKSSFFDKPHYSIDTQSSIPVIQPGFAYK